jgi:hypothetical protein
MATPAVISACLFGGDLVLRLFGFLPQLLIKVRMAATLLSFYPSV